MADGIRTSDPVDSIKDIVRSSMSVSEFDKHLKKARGHIGQNVVEITIKDEDNSLKTLVHLYLPFIFTIDKNHQASSQKFRQLINVQCMQLTLCIK